MTYNYFLLVEKCLPLLLSMRTLISVQMNVSDAVKVSFQNEGTV